MLFRSNAGNIILPSQGNIVGATANNSGSLQWIGNSSGDGYGYTTLQLRPDDTLTGDQWLVIDPTSPNHIHIRAGGTQDNSNAYLFFGGENSYFQVPAGSNPNVYVAANGNTWTFGVDGNLTIPGTINLVGGTSVIESSANNVSIYNEVSQTNGVVIWGDGLGNAGVELQSDGMLSFVTDNGNSSYQTVFLQNGNIQTAKGIFPVDDNTHDVGIGSNQFRDAYFGGNVNADVFRTTDGGLTHTGSAVGINADAGKDVYLYADGANVGWIFDTTGNVTIPKNILGPNNGNPIVVDAGSTGDSFISIPSFQDGGEQLVIKNRYFSSQGIRIETETGNFVLRSEEHTSELQSRLHPRMPSSA